jgi:hypothetical protein
MLLSVLALAVVLNQAAPETSRIVVERARVGPVSIGAAAEAVYSEFRDRARLVDLKLEGHLSPALELKLFGAQLSGSLIAEIAAAGNQLVVSRINVLDPTLRTREGIGIGSTYGELRAKYTVDWIGSGEGAVFARVETLAISFQLDNSGPTHLAALRDPAKVPPDVRIVGMLLTR